MKDPGALKLTTPTNRQIVLTRDFDAPRSLVFDAMTRSELRIIPLLMEVGVTRIRLRSRRTERLPSVPATKPQPCNLPPNRIISLRYWRWLAILKSTPGSQLSRVWYRRQPVETIIIWCSDGN